MRWELSVLFLFLASMPLCAESQTYSQSQLDSAIQSERARWDANNDNKIGLDEAIRALQIVSGMRRFIAIQPGFSYSDFSGKTIYLIDSAGYAKAIFYPDGKLRAYLPNQDNYYSEGLWSINVGKLEVARIEYPNKKTTYTIISNDLWEKYFKISRLNLNGTTETVGMFYDQITGLSQAEDFVNNQKTP